MKIHITTSELSRQDFSKFVKDWKFATRLNRGWWTASVTIAATPFTMKLASSWPQGQIEFADNIDSIYWEGSIAGVEVRNDTIVLQCEGKLQRLRRLERFEVLVDPEIAHWDAQTSPPSGMAADNNNRVYCANQGGATRAAGDTVSVEYKPCGAITSVRGVRFVKCHIEYTHGSGFIAELLDDDLHILWSAAADYSGDVTITVPSGMGAVPLVWRLRATASTSAAASLVVTALVVYTTNQAPPTTNDALELLASIDGLQWRKPQSTGGNVLSLWSAGGSKVDFYESIAAVDDWVLCNYKFLEFHPWDESFQWLLTKDDIESSLKWDDTKIVNATRATIAGDDWVSVFYEDQESIDKFGRIEKTLNLSQMARVDAAHIAQQYTERHAWPKPSLSLDAALYIRKPDGTKWSPYHIRAGDVLIVRDVMPHEDITLRVGETRCSKRGVIIYPDAPGENISQIVAAGGGGGTTVVQQVSSTGGGGGDMYRSVYDQNTNGIVDDAEKVGGESLASIHAYTDNAIATHTSDASAHHAPVTIDASSDPALQINGQTLWLDDVAMQSALDLHEANPSAHHAPITLGSGSDPILSLNGQELTLGNVATQAELNAHANDASAHHDPVTLTTDADGILSLSTQQIGIDAQAVGTVWAGPTSGGNAKPTFKSIGSVLTNADAGDLAITTIPTATVDTIQAWLNAVQSAGKIDGGDITDNGDGTVKVAEGSGFIKVSDSDTASTPAFNWAEASSITLTDGDTNYIYVEYNSGSPQIAASTTMTTDHHTTILLGLVYRDGTTLHIVTAGQLVADYASKTFFKDVEVRGKFQRASGLLISEKSDRKFAIDSGIVYAGLTRLQLSAFDSSAGDTFTYLYRDGSGGYTKVTGRTQIDNLHYDDGSGTLAELSGGWFSNSYGVHWVYLDADGHVYVVYGRGDYSSSEAEDAQPPSDVPDLLADIGGLVGKIVIEKNASSFTSIKSAFEQVFSPSASVNHNDLNNLQGGDGADDEFYHLTLDDYNRFRSRDDIFTADELLLLSPRGLITRDGWRTQRLQEATIDGAVHLVPGRWNGVQAVMVEEETENPVPNPCVAESPTGWIIETGGEGWREDPLAIRGGHDIHLDGSRTYDRAYTPLANIDATKDHVLSIYAIGHVEDCAWVAYDSSNSYISGNSMPQSGDYNEWTRINCILESSSLPSGTAKLRLRISVSNGTATNKELVIDAVQIQEMTLTSYVDGDLSDGYSWSSTPHNSTSTREATEISLDDHANLISENDAWSLALWWQPQYAVSSNWPSPAYLFDGYGSASEHITVTFDESDNKLKVAINGSTILESAAQTFDAGEWQHLVVTFDFASDSYRLAINGEIADTATDALTAPAIASVSLGSDYTGANQANAAYQEMAWFDRILSAQEITTLYLRDEPLADPAAIVAPVSNLPRTSGEWGLVAASDSTTSTSYTEVAASRIGWGERVAGTMQFEAVVKISDSSETVSARLTWNKSGTWYEVPGSEVTHTGDTNATLIRSGVIFLSPAEREYRVEIKTSDSAATATIYKARLVLTSGGLSEV